MILIALGANLSSQYGKPEETLEAAKLEFARRGIQILKSSRIIVTKPVPASDQPDYRNAAVSVSTALDARGLFKVLKSIEVDFGRVEAGKNAARILDLDLIAYGSEIMEGPDLIVPHPRMHERAFVLEPLREIEPEWVHPVFKLTATQLFHNLPEKVSRETQHG